MNPSVESARERLEGLLSEHQITRGLAVRVRGKYLTLVRASEGPQGEVEDDPRVRLTHLGGGQFGLSVLRHTGKWDRTPFTGTVEEALEVICGPMQHLVADWP